MNPQVMIIGMDGATLKLIRPWAEQGLLPNLAALLKGGTSGDLTSTIPPYTPTAWSSFYTGVNPGKHGIYSFTRFNPQNGRRELVNSRVIGAKKLWQILDENGLTSGFVNLPLTYPPEQLNGYMVTGMMTPEKSRNFTYPQSLAAELSSLPDPYIVDVPVTPAVHARNTDIIKVLKKALHGRRHAINHLLENHPCDVFMAVFVTPDRIQHVFWKYLDVDDPLYGTPEGENARAEIMECYILMDQAIGDMVERAGDNARIFLMSDHGFTGLRSEVFLNNWLAREGFFSLGSSSKLMWGPWYRKIRSSRLIRSFASGFSGRFREQGLKRMVEWDHTKAYAREQGLFINVKGREERGSVEYGEEYDHVRQQIADKLAEVEDPVTGKKLVDKIIFKERVYEGPFLDMAPDLIPVLDNYSCYVHDGVLRDLIVEDCRGLPYGAHDPAGVFIAHGPDIKSGKIIENANIIDVTPTILHCLGIPVPGHMDGRVLEELFEEEYLKSNPVVGTAGDTGKYDADGSVYSQEEADEIQEQLRGMGYLS